MCSLALKKKKKKGHIMTDTHVNVQTICFISFVWVSPRNWQLEDTHVHGKATNNHRLICFMKVLSENKTT